MPTVLKIQLDASDVKTKLAAAESDLQKFRQKVSAGSKTAASAMSGNGKNAQTDLKNPDVSVEPDAANSVTVKVSGLEEVRELSAEFSALPEKKEVLVSAKVNTEDLEKGKKTADEISSGALNVSKNTEKVSKAVKSIPAKSFTESFKSGLSSLREELSNTAGGAKKLLESFLAGGGAMGILVAGVASLGKIASHVYSSWINNTKEAGELAQKNAGSIREAAEASEQVRQKTDGYLSSLSSLSNSEKLSNTNKAEAVRLISELSKSYGDLGIRLDEITGKLTGVDEAMIRKLQLDKERRITELAAEMRSLQDDNNVQNDLIENAGIDLLFGYSYGGKQDRENAAARIEENMKRIAELQKKLRELQRSDPAGDYRRKRTAENSDLAKSLADQQRTFGQRKADDSFNALKDSEQKIQNRQTLLANHRKNKIDPLRQKITVAENAVRTSSGDAKLEAEKTLMQLQAELHKELEKTYTWEQQIANLKQQQAKTISDMTLSAKTEAEAARLILNGEYEKAELLKLEARLKQQNLRLTKEEKLALLDHGKALGETRLRDNLSGSARSLLYDSMTRAGMGREAENERALYDAGKTKGGTLTESETEMVRRLAALQYGLKNLRESSPGDLDIKTNSLTSRGGFAGGAVVPNSERINTAIKKEIERMRDTQKEIRDMIDRILNG